MITLSSIAPPSWWVGFAPECGVRLSYVLDEGGGLTKARGERSSADLTRVTGGSSDTPLSCSGSNRPPRRGAYFFPLMMLRVSPSSACPRVSWRRSFAGGFLVRSCSEGAFVLSAAAALPRPPGGVCTEASWSYCTVPPAFAEATERIRDVELSACCSAACSMSARASLRRLRPTGVEGSGMA